MVDVTRTNRFTKYTFLNMKELIKYANSIISEHPDLKLQIIEIIQLCQDEIEEGNSSQNEISIAYGAIKDLL